MPQVHGEARRVNRRICTRREKGDAAQGVRCIREGRCRQGPGISGIVRPGSRRPGRMHGIRALQVEARAAQGGAPDVRRPLQQACADARKAACDPGGHRHSRGQEGRARARGWYRFFRTVCPLPCCLCLVTDNRYGVCPSLLRDQRTILTVVGTARWLVFSLTPQGCLLLESPRAVPVTRGPAMT